MTGPDMTNADIVEPALEFVREFDTSTLGRAERRIELDASAPECVALARRFGLVEMKAFHASLKIVRSRNSGMVRVSGVLSADVVQECVVSLEPVEGRVEEDVLMRFAPTRENSDGANQDSGSAVGLDVVFDEEDPPEPMSGDIVELGEPLAQFLALGLNPYPQAPKNGEMNWTTESPKEAAAFKKDKDQANPFSVLAALKKESE